MKYALDAENTNRYRGQPTKETPSDRELKMKELYVSGMTLQEIANLQEPKITRERVRQLLTKYFGIKRNDGGRYSTVTAKLIDNKRVKLAMEQEWYLNVFKCSKETFLKINGSSWRRKDKSPANKYYNQRHDAQSRKIEWDISFPEWWELWEKSGRYLERGRYSGVNYCMTRIGDTGGYKIGNVEINTISDNFAESFYKTSGYERSKKIKDRTRGTKTHCKRGHERVISNTTKNGVCKECVNFIAREKRLVDKRHDTEKINAKLSIWYNKNMEKITIINYLGGYDQAWRKLKYKSIQPVYNWPNELSKGRMEAIIRRMKAEGVEVPKEWVHNV